MISFKHSRRPQLESLEARWVPATIKLFSGNLFISNQVGDLTVAPQATSGQVKVTDGAQSLTVSGVGSLISITGTNAANKITVDLAGNKFAGNVLINSGNGDDTIVIGGAGGSLGGNLTVLSGLGNDTVRLNRPTAGGGGLNIGGSTILTDTQGNDTLLVGNGTAVTKFGGSLSAVNFNTITMGVDESDIYGGSVTFSTISDGFPLKLNQGATGGTEVSPIGGNFTITAGSANDVVILRGLIVTGNLAVNLGGATVTNEFTTNSSASTVTTVNGNLTYQGGAGVDDIDIGGMTVNGNTSMYLGEGNDVVSILDFGPTPGTLLNGDLRIFVGNGALNANIGARIGGSVQLNLGNGMNDITFTTTSVVGGRLGITTGNGDNTLTLLGAQTYVVNMRFGSGADTLVLNNAALVLTGYVDAGGGANTFTQTMGTLSPFLTLIGF